RTGTTVDLIRAVATTVDVVGALTATTLQIDGNTLLGTTTAATGTPRLDLIANAGGSAPHFVGANTTADTTTKAFVVGLRHYTNAEEPSHILGGQVDATTHRVLFGGGRTGHNAATSVEFYTAAGNTTLVGTQRWKVDSAGHFITGGGAYDIGNGAGNNPNDLYLDGDATIGGLVLTAAAASGGSGLRAPHGTAPTSPVDGDIWTTTAGLFARINGSTVGPYTA
ncbi:hypothetical protein LCGC14_3112170, partial [marine sediment metagenome]